MYRYATELTEERSEYLLDKLSRWIVDHHLETPAVMFLESMKPLSFIGSQMWLMYGVPLLGIVVDERESSELGLLFENRENVEALIQRIETLAREADKKKEGKS
ncbi:MAG: hypothetical protein JSV51_07290 [Candidatus Bathyarchaeota archaeon]|nr:MAG: hypothetical protein JSV51_07290 [Candidatus Bathyarchaeota archaeon]